MTRASLPREMQRASMIGSIRGSDVAIIVVRLPRRSVVYFQSLLGGEDGLATLRCMDKSGDEQELWTTKAQTTELRQWLASMPPEMGIEVVQEAH